MLRPEIFIYETDPSKQTAAWADKVITRRRMDWRKVVSDTYYRDNKNILLSLQPMDDVKKYFEDVEFVANNPIVPLPFMEKSRNILISEAREAGISPYIKAVDSSAKKDKEIAKFRLQTRSQRQADINANRANIGLPPYQIDPKDFKGNIEDFDTMQLEEQEPSDVNNFINEYFKLHYETAAQVAVNAYLGVNRVEDDIPRYINDIAAVKVVCRQDYISPMNGQIVSRYLQPNQVYAIFGTNRDATDAAVRGWEKQITVQQLLNQLGEAFNFDRDWPYLVNAINYGSNTAFDGFIRNNVRYTNNAVASSADVNGAMDSNRLPNLLNYDDVYTDTYNYKVYFGYIEWEQPCVHSEKKNEKTGQMFSVANEYEPTERSVYSKVQYGYEKTKCSYYIATGAYSQRLYGYGDLFHMRTKGQADEFSCGSISIIREEGLSAVDVAKPYISIGNYAYYKMLWAIHNSRPDVWDYSYESIVNVAMKMMPTNERTNEPQKPGTFGTAVNSLIELLRKKLVMLHTYPIVDGQVVGGGGSQHQKIPGGLDMLAIQLREAVLEWAEFQIQDKLGMGGLRNAEQPNPRDTVRLNETYIKQSRAATGYIETMIESSFKHTSNVMLLYIQDIIRHKATIPYNYLLTLVGQDIVDSLSDIGDEDAPHRFAIYATSYSMAQKKAEMQQEARFAWQNGGITYIEYTLIKNIDEPRKAAMVLAYMQERTERRKAKEQQAQNEFAQKMQQESLAGQAQIEQGKVQGDIARQEKVNEGLRYVADMGYKEKMDLKEMTLLNEPEKQGLRTQSQKEVIDKKAEVEAQKPFGS